jgi:hypothetical protein
VLSGNAGGEAGLRPLTATLAWSVRSQFNWHPDPSGCARSQDGVHHRDTGKAILNRWKGQPRIGKGSGTTGHIAVATSV